MNREDTKKLSPMMQQYLLTKEEYSDCILLYRLGDNFFVSSRFIRFPFIKIYYQ